MPQIEFRGDLRFEEAELWQHEMKRWAAGFGILQSHSMPKTGGAEALVRIEYELPEGSYSLYARCITCGEFLLGRQLPEEQVI